jgi:hypothetical protein
MFRCRDIVGIPPPVTLNPFVRKYVASEGYVACSTPLLLAADLDNIWLAHLLLEKGAEVQYYVGSRGQLSPCRAVGRDGAVTLELRS